MTNIQDAEMFWGAEATKIDWETDGQEVDLPKNVEVPDDLDADEIADYLSDKHGFLVNSFQIKDAESFEADVEEHSCSECGEEGPEGVCSCYLDNLHGVYMVSIRANNCPFCKTKGFELGTPCNSCGCHFRKTKDSEGNMRWKEDTQTLLEMAYGAESFEANGGDSVELIAPKLEYSWETDNYNTEITPSERNHIDKEMKYLAPAEWDARGKGIPDAHYLSIDIERNGDLYTKIEGEWNVDWDAESFDAEGDEADCDDFYNLPTKTKRNAVKRAYRQYNKNYDTVSSVKLENAEDLIDKYENKGLTHGMAWEQAMKEGGLWDVLMDGVNICAIRYSNADFYDENNDQYNLHLIEGDFDTESFELHDWYDDMSDYGVMEMHPRIKEQKDEYLENQKNQSQVSKDEFPDNYFMKDSSESLHDRRLRNINRAVGKSNNLVSPIDSRMPISVRARMPELPSLPTNSKYLKYAAILAIASVVGYKVASK
jgi:hypothetical protein